MDFSVEAWALLPGPDFFPLSRLSRYFYVSADFAGCWLCWACGGKFLLAAASGCFLLCALPIGFYSYSLLIVLMSVVLNWPLLKSLLNSSRDIMSCVCR